MKKTKVEVTEESQIYINQDLANAAHWLKKRIEEQAAKKDEDRDGGLGLKVMACVRLLAFTVEAHFNFLGDRLIPKWKERRRFFDKIHAVLKKLDADNDLKQPPYKTIRQLKYLRDRFAHGKPRKWKWTYEAELTEEERKALVWPRALYEKCLTPEFAVEAYDNVDTIWKELLQKAKIDPADLLTNKSVSIKVIPETG